jgi:hypothetical protein
VWSVPVMGLLVFVAMPFNDGCYEYRVNDDPLGDAQQHEWIYTTRLFRYTSAVLSGQLPLLAGAALARRHAQATALVVAAPLAALRAR